MATDSPVGPDGQEIHKGRRSWYTPGKSLRMEVAVEHAPVKPCRLVEDEEIEELLLTHFTAPPRVDFGTLRLGKSATRRIQVRNPQDYEQHVLLEKFPFKAGFSCELTEFVVDAAEEFTLNITWKPTEAGNCRQMALFHVEGAYRLQAIFFGRVEEPPKTRKRKAIRASSRPFSVLQTNTLGAVNSRRATYNKTSPKAAPAAGQVAAVSPVAGQTCPEDKENTPPPVSIEKMGIASFTPRRLKKASTFILPEGSPSYFPSPHVQEAPVADAQDDKRSSGEFEDSLMVPPACKDAADEVSVDSQHQGTYELEESVILHQTGDEGRTDLSKQGTFEIDNPGTQESRHGTFDLESVNQSKHGTYELDSESCRSPVAAETSETKQTGRLTETVSKLKEAVDEMDDAGLVESLPLGDHKKVMDQLSSIRRGLADQLVASTPVSQNTRASFEALASTKLPSPVHGNACRVSDSGVKGNYFTSPLRSPGEAKLGNVHKRSPTAGSPKRHSRKLDFSPEVRRLSNATVTIKGALHLDKSPVKTDPVNNITVTKDGVINNDPTADAEFVQIPSPVGRRISTLTVTKQHSSIGRVTVTTDCDVSNICQQLSLSIQEQDIRSPPPKMSRSLLESSVDEIRSINPRRTLYTCESPKRICSSPLIVISNKLNTETSLHRSTQKLSEKRKAARRSAKLHRRHRRSVTRILDESERSFCELPDVEVSECPDALPLPEDEVVESQDNLQVNSVPSSGKKSPAMERLAKSPAKYSGITMLIKEPNTKKERQEVSVAKKALVTQKKKRSPIRKPSPRRISRGRPGKSPRRLSRERSSLTSLTRPTAASKARSSQAASVHVDVSVRKGQVRTSISSQPVKTTRSEEVDDKPKGFTRTMELRRKAALAKSGALDKPQKAGDVKSRAGAVPCKPRAKVLPKGLAKSKLTLIKPKLTQTALPKHPMPFAAKNIYYDERWMEKQERGFVRWLNFLLTPPDEHVDPIKPKKVDAGALCLDAPRQAVKLAPSKETLSLRAYTARRRLNQLRRATCMLFQSEAVVRIHRKLEVEIECGRLALRKDRKLHADIGLKQRVLDMLLSYNPLWLRICLETVFGEVLPLQDNTDIIGLSRFIITRLLGNPEIAQQFAHPTVPHLYRTGYEDCLAKFTLKKFLLLILMLDKAKVNRLLQHDPCLFCRDSEIKASRDVLIGFSRDFLSGEGDVTKHLGYMGYTVSHQQRALDEYDYAVETLATDLRDGVRLGRVVALLTESWDHTEQVRVPAISRLQKVHNTELAYRVLAQNGLDLTSVQGGKLCARDIVDGHREKTLAMLWSLIFNFQVGMLLNEQQLKDEIRILRENLQVRAQLASLLDQETAGLGLPRDRRQSTEPDMYFKSPCLSLLLKWCQTVCSYYQVKVENFTVSFSDGRVLCFLVHHYHPALLPKEAIHHDTTQTHHEAGDDSDDPDDSFASNWTSTYSPSTGKPTFHDELLSNERQNFKLLYEKVSELGGIPLLLRAADMSNTIPDEKVVLTYVSYLCMRLLDIRMEARAARIIQVAWRKYCLAKQRRLIRVQHASAVVIQHAIQAFLRRRRREKQQGAILVLQAGCRGYLARKRVAQLRIQLKYAHHTQAAITIQVAVRQFLMKKKEERVKAVVCLQAAWRRHTARHTFLLQQRAAIVIQRWVRHLKEQREMERQSFAALLIQQWWRAIQAGRCGRKHFIHLKWAAIMLQKHARGMICERQYRATHHAAIILQSAVRMQQERKAYTSLRKAVICLQQRIRARQAGKQQRLMYLRQKQAVVTIQKYFWQWKATRLQAEHQAICGIQATVRMKFIRKRYLMQRQAAVVIQSAVRGHQQRSRYQELCTAARSIQSWYRAVQAGHRQRQHMLLMQQAAITIQAAVRGHQARQVAIQERAARHIQATVRMWLSCRWYQRQRAAAVRIQRCWFTHQQRQQFSELRAAAVVIQQYYRATLQQRQAVHQYQCTRTATICLQAAWRGRQVRHQLRVRHEAATRIQAYWKSHYCMLMYQLIQDAVVRLQRQVRAYQAMKAQRESYCRLRSATITLQAAWRARVAARQYQHHRQAALCLQAHVRRYQAQRHYLRLQSAARTVQRYYRAKVLARQCQSNYQSMRVSAVRLQAWWRGTYQKHKYSVVRKAVIVLQSQVRRYIGQKHYHQQKQSAVIIQRWLRALQLSRQQRQAFLLLKGAALMVQATFKAKRQKRDYQRHRQAAIAVQSCYRRHRCQQQYQSLQQKTVYIQSWYRSLILGRQIRLQYLMTVGATITLQAHWRCRMQQRSYHCTRQAVICIQSHVRRHQASQNYQRVCTSVCRVQKWYRHIMWVREQQQRQEAAVSIQAIWRGYHQRKEYLCLRTSAVVIQACVRGHQVRQRLRDQQRAALYLQTWYRAVLHGRQQRQVYLDQRYSATQIQALYRGYVARRMLSRQTWAAVTIQACIRGHIQRCQFLQLRQATVTLQMYWQAFLLGRQQENAYQQQRHAAISLQSAYRGYTVRKSYMKQRASVITLQAAVRCYQQRQRFLRIQQASISLQCQWRARQCGSQQRSLFLHQRKAAITIQSSWRSWVQCKQYLQNRQNIILLQAFVRCQQEVRRYQELREMTCRIQRWFRAVKAMDHQRAEYRRSKEASICIQSMWRGHMARKSYLQQRDAAIVIQAAIRGHLVRQCIQKRHSAARCIQSHYLALLRGRHQAAIYHITRGAIITCQAAVRGWLQRKAFLKLRAAAVSLQAHHRGWQARQQCLQRRNALLVLQKYWKASVLARHQRQQYLRIRQSAITIQANYRALQIRRALHRLQCVVKLQACVRRMVVQRKYEQTREHVIRLQAAVRAYICRNQYQSMRRAVLLLQQHYHAYREGCRQRSVYIQYRQAAVCIQAASRGHMVRRQLKRQSAAATCIQAWYRRYKSHEAYQQLRSSAVLLQQCWRAQRAARAQHQAYLIQKGAVITIQAWYRGNRWRQELQALQTAATCIQSVYRRKLAERHYILMKKSAVVIQRQFRNHQHAKAVRAEYVHMKQSAVVIQRQFRNHQHAKAVRAEYVHMKQSAVVIQRQFRNHQHAKAVRADYVHMKQSAVVIQRQFRNHQHAKAVRAEYVHMKQSAVVIQRQFRNHQHAKAVRADYVHMKQSAVVIQRQFRNHQHAKAVRAEYVHMKQSAVVIQRQFRNHQHAKAVRAEYVHMKQSAVVIQRQFRNHQHAKAVRAEYVHMKQSAVVIQRQFRNHQHAKAVRAEYVHMKQSAVVIQRQFRNHQHAKAVCAEYVHMKQSAVVIQRQFRNHQLAKAIRAEYVHMKQNAIKIQATYKAYHQRNIYRTQRRAAILVQSHVRMWLSRKQYMLMKAATIVIQCQFRAQISMQLQRARYQRVRSAAVTLQSAWRAHLARTHYQYIREQVTLIQSLVRSRCARRRYVALLQATRVIQARWRAVLLSRLTWWNYQVTVGAVITLQSAARMFAQKRQYQQLRQCTCKLQACVRGKQQRAQYLQQYAAIVTLQRRWRATQCMRQTYRWYSGMQQSIITLQAATRGWLARQEVRRIRAAICLQSAVRMYKERKQFVLMKHYTVRLQAHVRCKLALSQYRMKLCSARTLQSRWRAQLWMRRERHHFVTVRAAALAIQCHFRGWQARCQADRIRAAVCIQSTVRMHQERRKYCLLRQAAVYIQSCIRAKQQRIEYMQKQQAIQTLQKYWRAQLSMRQQREAYCRMRYSVVVLQSAARIWLSRKQEERVKAAVCIQAAVRMYQQCHKYRQLKQSITCLQARVRGKQQLARFRAHYKAILTLQGWIRSQLQMKKDRKNYIDRRSSVILLQSAVRGWLARQEVRRIQAAICIQSAVRMYRARKMFLQLRQHATRVQAGVRAKQQRASYLKMRHAAVSIQLFWRSVQQMKKEKDAYQQLQSSATTLQSHVRGWLARRAACKLRACIYIQSMFRMYQQRRKFLQLRNAAICIQTNWRGYMARQLTARRSTAVLTLQLRVRAWLAGRVGRRLAYERWAAVVNIQAYTRGWLARRETMRRRQRQHAAVLIQSRVRGYQLRQRYQKQRSLVVRLQSRVRGWLARSRYSQTRRKHQAAICIQQAYKNHRIYMQKKCEQEKRLIVIGQFTQKAQHHLQVIRCQRVVRRYLLLQKAKHQLAAIITLQRWMRGRLQRLRYLRLRQSVQLLQSVMRWYMAVREEAAVKIQAGIRRWLLKCRVQRKHEAATRIQAVWRGWQVRKRNKDRRLRDARRRVQKATEAATEENTLGSRTTSALDYLLQYKQLSYILEAVRNLEVATRLSPRCCVRMVEANAVSVIFRLIRSCNRSLPHMEIIKFSVMILLNLAKYEKTVQGVYEVEESIESLVELLQIYRGKGTIFTSTCTLIAILCHEPHRRKEVVSMGKVVEKFRSLYALTSRQVKLDEKRTITKNRLVAARGALMAGTPRKHMHIRPDWVLKRNSIREIEDPLQAITFVMNTLRLVPK